MEKCDFIVLVETRSVLFGERARVDGVVKARSKASSTTPVDKCIMIGKLSYGDTERITVVKTGGKTCGYMRKM